MTREVVTEKLIELRRYCAYEAESDENGSGIWCDDVNALDMAISALREQDATDTNVGHKWISVEESMPDDWVSVLGYMTDAGEFPPVRECYAVDGNFWFPALREFHPVSHWMPMPTKEEA